MKTVRSVVIASLSYLVLAFAVLCLESFVIKNMGTDMITVSNVTWECIKTYVSEALLVPFT